MVIIPYVNQTSERIAKVFKKYGVTSVMKPPNSIRQKLVHPKDKILKEKSSGVVYQIPCRNCSASYIGETGREYAARKKEHQTDVEKNRKRYIHVQPKKNQKQSLTSQPSLTT